MYCNRTGAVCKPFDTRASFYVPNQYDRSWAANADCYWHSCYLMNLLHWRWICYQGNEDGFVQLKVDYLRRFIPWDLWKAVLYPLLDHNIIECDNRIVVGSKCLGYRFTPAYWNTHRVYYEDDALNGRISRWRKQEESKLLAVHRALQECLYLLEIDLRRAYDIILTLEPDEGFKQSREEYYTRWRAHCQKIADKEHYVCVDLYGRFHSLLTCLPKELRCCLRAADRCGKGKQPLLGLDLKNSQPLIAGVFAGQFYRDVQTRWRLLNKEFTDRANPYCPQEIRALTRAKITLPADLQAFVKVCEQGVFYESLMKPGENKQAFKVRFFTEVLFGKNCYRSELKDRFQTLYPALADILHALKKKDHARSAWVMQNYEATMFICNIAGKFVTSCPRAFLATLHDCLLIHPKYEEQAASLLLGEWAKLGVKPTIDRVLYQ